MAYKVDSILFVCIRSASSLGFNNNEICGNRFEKAPKATTVAPTKMVSSLSVHNPTYKQINGQVDKQTKKTSKQMNSQTDKQTNNKTEIQTKRHTDRNTSFEDATQMEMRQ
jgi:hypothetical protein